MAAFSCVFSDCTSKVATWLELNTMLMTHGRIMVNCGGVHAEAANAEEVACSNNGSWAQNSTIKALCKAFPENVSYSLQSFSIVTPLINGPNFRSITIIFTVGLDKCEKCEKHG